MKAGDVVMVNAPGGFLDKHRGVVEMVRGEYAAVLIGENVYMIMDVALELAPPGVCPTCGAELPDSRRKGE